MYFVNDSFSEPLRWEILGKGSSTFFPHIPSQPSLPLSCGLLCPFFQADKPRDHLCFSPLLEPLLCILRIVLSHGYLLLTTSPVSFLCLSLFQLHLCQTIHLFPCPGKAGAHSGSVYTLRVKNDSLNSVLTSSLASFFTQGLPLMFPSFLPLSFLPSFHSPTCSIWRFPGYGSNQSYSCWPTQQLQQHGI